MTNSLKLLLSAATLALVAACSNAEGPKASEAPAEVATANFEEKAEKVVDYAAAESGAYMSEATHRYISFSYDHQGYSQPVLRWRDWTSELNWDAANPANSSVSVSIDVAAIDSGVDIYDDHLRSDQWFDAAQFPTISFESTALNKVTPTTGTVDGNLTIKGITKPVTLDVVLNKTGFDERNNVHKIGLSATTKVLRSDFDLGAYVPFVGDEVSIVISAEYIKPAAAE